jgi:hypothetical protein
MPGPRQCPICAGTGYVVTDDPQDSRTISAEYPPETRQKPADPFAPGPGGSDEMFAKPIPYKHPMDPDQ